MKRQVVVFDFDGTLIRKDSFIQFIVFVHGRWQLYAGLLLHLHLIIGYFLNIISSERLKQRLFAYFFRGTNYATFCRLGEEFATRIESFERNEMVTCLHDHAAAGDIVLVISATIREWLLPWCCRHGVEHVLSTEIEVSADGIVTGQLSTPNCKGPQKVARLLKYMPDVRSYRIVAYGDSKGDREMMAFADEAWMV